MQLTRMPKRAHSSAIVIVSRFKPAFATPYGPSFGQALTEWTDEMFDRAEHRVGDKVVRRGRPPLEAPKQQVTLRLDQDVLDHFRAGGAGWQSCINAVLREAIEQTV